MGWLWPRRIKYFGRMMRRLPKCLESLKNAMIGCFPRTWCTDSLNVRKPPLRTSGLQASSGLVTAGTWRYGSVPAVTQDTGCIYSIKRPFYSYYPLWHSWFTLEMALLPPRVVLISFYYSAGPFTVLGTRGCYVWVVSCQAGAGSCAVWECSLETPTGQVFWNTNLLCHGSVGLLILSLFAFEYS